MTWALLPIKNFSNAKQRLSKVLSEKERRQLFYAMVEDVIDALLACSALEKIIIVSDDPRAKLLAQYYGVLFWAEESLAIPVNCSDLSTIVDAAARKISEQGAQSMLVVHGDLPLLKSDEIQQLINQHQTLMAPAVTIAPDTICDGSNCVLSTPPNAIPFQYGRGSYHKHLFAAKKNEVSTNNIQLSGTSWDIDTPFDFERLSDIHYMSKLLPSRASQISKHTRRYLNKILIDQRLHRRKSDRSLWSLLKRSLDNILPTNEQALLLAEQGFLVESDMTQLMAVVGQIRDQGFRNVVTYSRKVFIPLTQLCRDVCHYCTFAQHPIDIKAPFMSVEEVLASVHLGVEQGCKEALFTLGEKPELRYRVAREALDTMGFASTVHYVCDVAKRVFEDTGILPHINAGCMTEEEIALLRPVSASMGLMLESASTRLCEKGMPHYGSPDKDPIRRLQTIEYAGQAGVPTTSGILIGIGETRRERIESLLALRELHRKYGHLQEIIIQNFRAKAQTKMARAPEPDLNELIWTIAVARLIFGASMSIQAPPNLSPGVLPKIISAGINDWGGISPVTPDYVNPEAPWPHLDQLAAQTKLSGKYLHERLTIYPGYAIEGEKWLDKALQTAVLRMIDSEGFPRIDTWSPGSLVNPPEAVLQQLDTQVSTHVSSDIKQIIASARSGVAISETDVIRLFQARGDDFSYVCQHADQFRSELNGDSVSYVVNRNINYTNICSYQCRFCAFSKGKSNDNLRGRPYDLSLQEIKRRSQEAWERGATEVCMQGGIHPHYSGDTYESILRAVKAATPDMHVHAFSPLEIYYGAETSKLSLRAYLKTLKKAGLDTLPGTAAEVLDDEVRAVLCPDKINSAQWLSVMETAHQLGIKTTATIMYGHIEKTQHWARHLLHIRELQKKTGGFTEFVPLPFVHMEAPIYLKGQSRMGPTFREAILMHAVARIVLSPWIKNIQTSWVKMGERGVLACLHAGANDLGGTLMNETITRAAGASHGQEYGPDAMKQLIALAGRSAWQRTTAYAGVSNEGISESYNNVELIDVISEAYVDHS